MFARGASRSARVTSRAFSSMNFLNADSGSMATSIYHRVNTATLVLTPIAFLVPSSLSLPVDLSLGVLFPVHGHIGLNYVVTDYLPKIAPISMLPAARMAVMGITGVTALGLLKINVMGGGITKTLRSLWSKPDSK